MTRFVKIGTYAVNVDAVDAMQVEGNSLYAYSRDFTTPFVIVCPDGPSARRAMDLILGAMSPPAPTPTPLIPDYAALLTPRQRAADALYSACRMAVEHVDKGIGRKIDVLHELNKALFWADKEAGSS